MRWWYIFLFRNKIFWGYSFFLWNRKTIKTIFSVFGFTKKIIRFKITISHQQKFDHFSSKIRIFLAFLLISLSNGWISFFLAEIINSFGWTSGPTFNCIRFPFSCNSAISGIKITLILLWSNFHKKFVKSTISLLEKYTTSYFHESFVSSESEFLVFPHFGNVFYVPFGFFYVGLEEICFTLCLRNFGS